MSLELQDKIFRSSGSMSGGTGSATVSLPRNMQINRTVVFVTTSCDKQNPDKAAATAVLNDIGSGLCDEVTIERKDSGNYIEYTIEVLEFVHSGGASVQSGSAVLASGNSNWTVNITDVAHANSFHVTSHQLPDTSTFDNEARRTVEFDTSGSDATDLYVSIAGSTTGASGKIAYYVVTDSDITAAEYSDTIADTATSSNQAITSVTTSRAFIIMSSSGDNGEPSAVPRSYLASATQVTSERDGSSDDAVCTIQVVECASGAGVSVERGSTSFSSTDSTKDISITSDYEYSVAVIPSPYGFMGGPDTTTAGDMEDGWVKSTLSSGNLEMDRQLNNATTLDMRYAVVEFTESSGVTRIPDCMSFFLNQL